MPIEELINVYLPQFSGILDNYWGRNIIHFHSEYIGAAVLMLASAAFGGDERKAFMKTCLSAKPAKQESKMAMCNKKTSGMKAEERAKAQSECMKG
jgi:hypothetical protein